MPARTARPDPARRGRRARWRGRLTLVFDPAEHDPFLQALRATSERDVTLASGATVAIEVELRPAKTWSRNAERDRDFTLTVLAVLGGAQEFLGTLTPTDRVIVVDVLRLLDALRKPA